MPDRHLFFQSLEFSKTWTGESFTNSHADRVAQSHDFEVVLVCVERVWQVTRHKYASEKIASPDL